VRLKRRAGRKDLRNNSASLVGIVHRGRKAIVRRVIVVKVARVATIAVQTEDPVEGDPKVVTKAVPVVAAVDDLSKDSPPRSSWRS
jgi:hypothetical protein